MDEIALIRDTINHYGPVFIAPLSIQIRRAGVQKKFGGRAGRGWPPLGSPDYTAASRRQLWADGALVGASPVAAPRPAARVCSRKARCACAERARSPPRSEAVIVNIAGGVAGLDFSVSRRCRLFTRRAPRPPEAPTVEALVQRLGDAQAARPALRALARPAEILLSYAQRRLWFLDRLDRDNWDLSR